MATLLLVTLTIVGLVALQVVRHANQQRCRHPHPWVFDGEHELRCPSCGLRPQTVRHR